MDTFFTATELSRILNVDRRTASARLRKLHVEPAATIGGRPVYAPNALVELLADSPQARRLGITLEQFIPVVETVS